MTALLTDPPDTAKAEETRWRIRWNKAPATTIWATRESDGGRTWTLQPTWATEYRDKRDAVDERDLRCRIAGLPENTHEILVEEVLRGTAT